MGVFEIISLIGNLLLGSGFIIQTFTLKAVKKEASGKAQQAVAKARADEIQNVEAAIKIWRQMAQDMADKYEAVSLQVEKLSKEVRRLNTINNRIVKLLDKITADNLESMIAAIKKTINENED